MITVATEIMEATDMQIIYRIEVDYMYNFYFSVEEQGGHKVIYNCFLRPKTGSRLHRLLRQYQCTYTDFHHNTEAESLDHVLRMNVIAYEEEIFNHKILFET